MSHNPSTLQSTKILSKPKGEQAIYQRWEHYWIPIVLQEGRSLMLCRDIHNMRMSWCRIKGLPYSTIYRNNLDDPMVATEEFELDLKLFLKRCNAYLIMKQRRIKMIRDKEIEDEQLREGHKQGIVWSRDKGNLVTGLQKTTG